MTSPERDELTPHEVCQTIHDLLSRKDDEYTWVTGEVDLVTRSEGKMTGQLESADESSVVISTDAGDRRFRFEDIVNIIWQMSSPGPE